MSTAEISANHPTLVSNPSMTWRGLLEFEKTIFVVLNLMDIVMTYRLLSTGSFYESNPIANFVLDGWGFFGMIAFKLILVGLVLLIANVVAIWRVGTARKLLYLGSFMIGTVVTYSYYLMLNFLGWI